MTKQIRLNAFAMNCVAHQSPGLWTHPRDRTAEYNRLPYWIDLAKTLERGRFDGLFLADVLGVYDVYGNSPDAALRHATQTPANEPLMLIPAMAAHQKNAEAVMNYYYDPKVAAEVAAYVQYISPVKGAKEEIAKIDPSLVENQFIFPTDETLSQVKIFQPLTPAQQTAYEARFQQIIGN